MPPRSFAPKTYLLKLHPQPLCPRVPIFSEALPQTPPNDFQQASMPIGMNVPCIATTLRAGSNASPARKNCLGAPRKISHWECWHPLILEAADTLQAQHPG